MKIRDLGATTGPRPHAIKLTEYGTACSDPSPIAQRNANKYGMPAIGGGQPETTTGILKNSPTSVMASPAAHRPHSAGQRGDGDALHKAKFGVAAELAPIGGGGPVSPMTSRSALGGGAALRASGFGMSARDGFGGKDPNFSPSPPPSQWLIMAREARDQAVPLRETSPSWAMQDSNVAKLGYDMGETLRLTCSAEHNAKMAHSTKDMPSLPPRLAFGPESGGGGSVADGGGGSVAGGASIFTSATGASAMTSRSKPVPGCTSRPSSHHIALSQSRATERQGTRTLNDGLALLLNANRLVKDGRFDAALPLYEEAIDATRTELPPRQMFSALDHYASCCVAAGERDPQQWPVLGPRAVRLWKAAYELKVPETGMPAAQGIARARAALRCGNILQRDKKYKPAAAFFRRCALADDSAEQINAREAHRSLGFCINVMRADAGDDAPPPITLRKRKSGRGTPKSR